MNRALDLLANALVVFGVLRLARGHADAGAGAFALACYCRLMIAENKADEAKAVPHVEG